MSKTDESLLKLVQELTERVGILISDRNSLLKENNYLRSLFCIDHTEAPPALGECDERWNKIVDHKHAMEKRITEADVALTSALLLISSISQLEYLDPDSDFGRIVKSTKDLILNYSSTYKCLK